MSYIKYGNKKTHCLHGHMHDSKKEARRCNELHLMQRAGEISGLQTQISFELIPKQKDERKCEYKADFVYVENGQTIVEDVKGVKTKEYIIKRKLFKYKYPQYVFKET